MKKVKVVCELAEDGDIFIASSVQDAAMIVLILEKAKMKILNRLELKEASRIVTPESVN